DGLHSTSRNTASDSARDNGSQEGPRSPGGVAPGGPGKEGRGEAPRRSFRRRAREGAPGQPSLHSRGDPSCCRGGTSARLPEARAGPDRAGRRPTRAEPVASSGPRRGRAGRGRGSGKVTRARGGSGGPARRDGAVAQRGGADQYGRRGCSPVAGGVGDFPLEVLRFPLTLFFCFQTVSRCLRALQKLHQRRDISSWLARWFPKTPAKAVVAQKTPIKVELVAGKTYRWCVCGRSKKQPFCDGSHFFQRTGLSPLKFKAQETRAAVLCTCKATQKPPYCDGTHKSERVQKAEVGSPL
uniref:MLLT6, PHD finger containing n=1 Tax=Equus asinus TaxID=9793 RepID=A0A9L0IF08_EQUAS